jgi:hypothetical protein
LPKHLQLIVLRPAITGNLGQNEHGQPRGPERRTRQVTRWHRVNEDIIRAALAALPHRDRSALRDAAPALRDLTTSIDAQAD